MFFIPFFFTDFFFHPTEKMYPNGLLKDAINNRSILTPTMRFSHDRSSNGANDGDGKTTNADTSSAPATEKADNSANYQVRMALNLIVT